MVVELRHELRVQRGAWADVVDVATLADVDAVAPSDNTSENVSEHTFEATVQTMFKHMFPKIARKRIRPRKR